MDIIAHTLYGGTICSRSGLAGGARGAPGRGGGALFRDRTLWLAFGFGMLPDVVSMWPSFVLFLLEGVEENFFVWFDGPPLILYRVMHSLLVALLITTVLWCCRRSWAVPSLAWSVHLVMDAATHGAGKFATLLFYPVSSFYIDGIRWWRHRGLVVAYWVVLPLVWAGLWAWRRHAVRTGRGRR